MVVQCLSHKNTTKIPETACGCLAGRIRCPEGSLELLLLRDSRTWGPGGAVKSRWSLSSSDVIAGGAWLFQKKTGENLLELGDSLTGGTWLSQIDQVELPRLHRCRDSGVTRAAADLSTAKYTQNCIIKLTVKIDKIIDYMICYGYN